MIKPGGEEIALFFQRLLRPEGRYTLNFILWTHISKRGGLKPRNQSKKEDKPGEAKSPTQLSLIIKSLGKCCTKKKKETAH